MKTQPTKSLLYFRRFCTNPLALVGAIIFLFFLFTALCGNLISPYEFQAQDIQSRLQPPSLSHIFGTDQFGRDIFSRILVGSQGIFLLGGVGTLLATIVGTTIGLTAGFYGKNIDEILMRILDVFMSFPSLLLALIVLSTLGPSPINLVLVVAVIYSPIIARVVRSIVLEIKTREYIDAARVRGEKNIYILFVEILPNVLPPLFVEVAMRFSYSIFMIASLGFLGLGVQPPAPDWGLQINEARGFFHTAPWTLLFPAGAIALLVISVNFMSDGFRNMLQASAAKR